MFEERREEPREPLALAVRLSDGVDAVTRDVSPSGMYLQIPGEHDLTGPLFFEMRVDEPKMKFTSEGRIVRIDHVGGVTGVALRLVSPRLQLLD